MSDRDLIAGHVVGYRGWRLLEEWGTVRLESLNGTVWARGDWMRAECDGECREVPGDDCVCGIYAAMDRPHLHTMHYVARSLVTGSVALAGKVIPGTQGWRAERARPLRIEVPYVRWELVAPLREAYRCEVVLGSPQRWRD